MEDVTREKFKVKIDKYKVKVKQGLSDDGETANITITFNDDLKSIVQNSTIRGTMPIQMDLGVRQRDSNGNLGSADYLQVNRYKVKAIIYSALPFHFKDLLFITELVDNGEYTYTFGDLEKLERFKSELKDAIYSILKAYLSTEVTQEITYKVKRQD